MANGVRSQTTQLMYVTQIAAYVSMLNSVSTKMVVARFLQICVQACQKAGIVVEWLLHCITPQLYIYLQK